MHPVHAPPETACLLLQLRLALNGGTLAKQREYFWRLAETCDRLGNMEEAEEHLKSLMDMDLTPEQKLEALCFLADVQVSPQKVAWELSAPGCRAAASAGKPVHEAGSHAHL